MGREQPQARGLLQEILVWYDSQGDRSLMAEE